VSTLQKVFSLSAILRLSKQVFFYARLREPLIGTTKGVHFVGFEKKPRLKTLPRKNISVYFAAKPLTGNVFFNTDAG